MPDRWSELLADGVSRISSWEAQWPQFAPDPTVTISDEAYGSILGELAERLQDNYPFFHPTYAGQMLKPPHAIAAAAYAMAQRINPNAHALDGGPATSRLEIEVVRQLATMCGFDPDSFLGHLTSSGTIANLEALWVARETHPEKGIACSDAAHYTHERMCQVLRMPCESIPSDRFGHIDLASLERSMKRGRIGTVVATAGTTSIGAVDDIGEIRVLADRYGARVHVDAAYGGFFQLLAREPDNALRAETAASLRAICNADSVVIDPHKHGLQPYGCGSVLFRDSAAGLFYQHDSPYTYFTSAELHLGEISLECSRAGAAAAALWATLRAFPLTSTGLGEILRQTRAAAEIWAGLISAESSAHLVAEPELDIIAFYLSPLSGNRRASAISELTQSRFESLMTDPKHPVHLATLRVSPAILPGHEIEWDADRLLVFRSVLMKPEHREAAGELHRRVMSHAGRSTHG